jgi:hypothetical protein
MRGVKGSRMGARQRQRGATFLGWLFVLALLAFFGLLILRLFPIYLEYFNVKTSLESLSHQPELRAMSQKEIRYLLQRRLDVNEVKHVSPADIELTKSQEMLKIVIDYEVRTPLLGNIDLIIHFNRPMEVSLL